jgi:6-pyruvoyltetrahydropterin/6-carboxytetrahydropterin synthase
MTKIRVSKRFSFDMAHALYGYDGPCKNIHGHTYHLTVSLLGIPLVDVTNPKLGMVVDFGDVKGVVKKFIIDVFDHALVLNDDAPYAKQSTLLSEFENVILTPFQPTCENLLLYFVELLQDKFPKELTLIAIRLEETPTSFAEWFLSDNF